MAAKKHEEVMDLLVDQAFKEAQAVLGRIAAHRQRSRILCAQEIGVWQEQLKRADDFLAAAAALVNRGWD